MSATSDPPLKNFGFTYNYEGTSFVWHIVAHTAEEGLERFKLMGEPRFEGELREATTPT